MNYRFTKNQIILFFTLGLFFIQNGPLMAKENDSNVQQKYFHDLANQLPYGIEIWHAGPAVDRSESLFGHLALRFLINRKNPSLDPVVNFVALVDKVNPSKLKAMIGVYDLSPEIDLLKNFIASQGTERKRNLTMTIIPSTIEQRIKLRDLVVRLYLNPEEKYNFFTNNCTSALQKALRLSGFDLPEVPDYFPANIEKYLAENGISNTPSVVINNLPISEKLLDLYLKEQGEKTLLSKKIDIFTLPLDAYDKDKSQTLKWNQVDPFLKQSEIFCSIIENQLMRNLFEKEVFQRTWRQEDQQMKDNYELNCQ